MVLSHWARANPNQVALAWQGGAWSFAELNGECNRLAKALRGRGLDAGDSLALMCSNLPEFVVVWGAAARIGLRLTPVNVFLQSQEAAYIVENCGAKAVVLDAGLGPSVEGLRERSNAPIRIAVNGEIDDFDPFAEVVSNQDPADIEDPVFGTVMFYTSGTTGLPKGVKRNADPDSRTDAQNLYRYEPGDRHLCTGPLYHAAPLAFSLAQPLAFGAGVVLMRKWDAKEALRLIDDWDISHTHMVPTMFHRLLSLPEPVRKEHETSSVRYVIHGAAPCPVEVKQRMLDWLGPVVYEYYAATEGLGTFVSPETWQTKPGTVGKPRPEGQVIVGDEDAAPLGAGEIGLVWIKAPDTARFEYHGDAEKTSSAYRGDYFTLGDMGYFDDDGYLYLTDRSANLIISGGVNIYPAEVDAVLLEHPAVGDAAVIGVPHDEWGEEVKAVIELQDGHDRSSELEAELIEFCRDRLAHYKCPRSVDFVDVLPRADNGKIYKRILREHYRELSSGD
ncbi:MAG: acyl-CoA synthase [Acidobacteria bacterium]|nr:MAG: acyl-CoA synthase [Acidobacteriota bacterium]